MTSFARLIARRLAWALVTLLGVSVLTFAVVYRIPADPAQLLAGQSASPEVVASIRRRHRLDQPVAVQYVGFLGRAIRGDLGESFVHGRPVAELIGARLPATAALALCGWLAWLVLGTLVGVWAAARRSPAREGALLALSIASASTPTFWVGILLLYVFVSQLRWLPAGGSGTPAHLVLPVTALAFAGVGYYARLAHSAMRETLGQDYIRTAAAKGLPPGRVLFRHALRNALLPLVTAAGSDLAALLGGVVFTEAVFDWHGMGQLTVQAVRSLDIPVIVGVVMVSALIVVLVNLAVDLLYPILDPRVRSG